MAVTLQVSMRQLHQMIDTQQFMQHVLGQLSTQLTQVVAAELATGGFDNAIRAEFSAMIKKEVKDAIRARLDDLVDSIVEDL